MKSKLGCRCPWTCPACPHVQDDVLGACMDRAMSRTWAHFWTCPRTLSCPPHLLASARMRLPGCSLDASWDASCVLDMTHPRSGVCPCPSRMCPGTCPGHVLDVSRVLDMVGSLLTHKSWTSASAAKAHSVAQARRHSHRLGACSMPRRCFGVRT